MSCATAPLLEEGVNAAAAAKEICAVEGEGTVHPSTARKWFQRFRSSYTSLDDKPKSGRPVTTDIDALLNAVEGNPGASTRQLSTEVQSSQTSVVRHLHQLGFHSRQLRMVPHDLTPAQAQQRVTLCAELLRNPTDDRFWRRIITNDEKWILFRYPDTGKQLLRPGTEVQSVVQRGRFEVKTMLCVWWNFKGSVYWELVPQGRTVDRTLYAEQLQRVYDIVRRRYPALINRERLLLQFDNAPCHRSRRVRQKIAVMAGVEILPHPPYSPDLAPSDFHVSFHGTLPAGQTIPFRG